MQLQPQLLAVAAVATRLGVSANTVRMLDPVLNPVRDSNNRRLYTVDAVERVAAERATRK